MKKVLVITPSAISMDTVGAPLMLARLFSKAPSGSYAVVARDDVGAKPRTYESKFIKYTLGNFRETRASIAALKRAGTAAIAKEKPDLILITSDSGPCFMAGYALARKHNLPYDLFIFDLWLGNFLKPFDRLLAYVYNRRILKRARVVFAAGEGLARYFKKRYGIEATVINNPIPAEAQKPLEPKKQNATPVMLYPGSVYWAQADALCAVAAALQNLGIELHIYTPQSPEQLEVLGLSGAHIKILPPQPTAEIVQRERDSDILLLALSFKRHGRRVLETASPGKFSEFLASGTPILTVAPPATFISQYSRDKHVGLAVNDLRTEEIRTLIDRLLSDPTLRRNLTSHARELALKEYTVEKNSQRLLSALGIHGA